MQVKVRLFATLREGRDKEVTVDIPEGASGWEMLEKLDIQREEVAIYLKNGRNASPEDTIEARDVVSVFPPVGGG